MTDTPDLRTRIARVYDHITHGRISKPDTDYRAVLAEADECVQRQIDAAVAEALFERTRQEVPEEDDPFVASPVALHRSLGGDARVLTERVIDRLTDSGLRDVAYTLARVQLGMSSAGMARWAILTPTSDEYRGYLPCDMDDLGRCERLYEQSPPWLQGRMLPLLDAFRAHVAGRRANV